MTTTSAHRILIVDDNEAIHEDFRKILAPSRPDSTVLDELERKLFDEPTGAKPSQAKFELASALQGKDACDLVAAAYAAGAPFALAFVDMRMPPGWDGLETIEQLWKIDPDLQIVVCSAYSDHSWNDFRTRLGDRDGWLVLKKPIETIEVLQCAHALTTKWELARRARVHVDELEAAVRVRTQELQQAHDRIAAQMLERTQIETELRLAQKLEAVGQLASGIAHEINTPLQYVGDNLSFLREVTVDLVTMIQKMLASADELSGGAAAPLHRMLQRHSELADFAYLAAEIPTSLDSIEHGVARVSKIVRAMKELTHPGSREAMATDLNRAISNALEVTANTYRFVADVHTDLADVPPVTCYLGEINQVFLSLIVNAAHAMEVRRREGKRGSLSVSTRVEGDEVIVAFADTGCGIAEADRERVFDAFFTTKEVGRGTGQGLAIARAIVVDRHGGSLTFDSKPGVGTTFFVRIPISGPRPRKAAQPSTAAA